MIGRESNFSPWDMPEASFDPDSCFASHSHGVLLKIVKAAFPPDPLATRQLFPLLH